jgi:integrase
MIAMAMIPGVRPKHLRDRALFLLGFAGAFRRSELVGLDVEDLEETDPGLRITIRKSKTTRRASAARSPSFGVDRPWSTLSDPRKL